MIRVSSWTGEEFEGKGYILTSTEGTEIVSEEEFMAPWRPADPPADSGEEPPVEDDQEPTP